MTREAECQKCGETFNPHPEDCECCGHDGSNLEHWQRNDGEECGGQGVVVGEWE